MTHNVDAVCTSGYVGEFAFGRLLVKCKLPQVRMKSIELVEIAKQFDCGCRRLSQALPYLRSEYGTQVRTPEGKYRVKLDWQNIPPEAILDKVYGLDAIIRFRGWTIGIDVTTNHKALLKKQKKLNWLTPLCKKSGIDHVAVIHLVMPEVKSAQTEQASSNLIAELRQVIKERRQVFTLTV